MAEIGSFASPGSVDLNGDGKADTFRYDPITGAWAKELGSGNGSFTRYTGGWSPGWTVAACQFNRDGRTDLFIYNPTTGAWMKAYSDVSGDFTYNSGTWAGGWNTYVLDLDGD